MRSKLLRIVVIGLVPLLGACAISHTDAQGRTHLVGFMALTLPSGGAADRDAPGAEQWRMRSLGVSVTSSPSVGSAVVLGYSDSSQTWLRNNSRIVITGAVQGEQGAGR